MLARAQIARTFTIYGYFIILISFTFVVILPPFGTSFRYLTNITDPGKLMPLQTYYIYDTNKSPFYEITFILQSITVMTAGVMYTNIYTFLGLLVFHICGQLENLSARILRIDENNFESNLSYIVQDHRRLIRFRTCCQVANKFSIVRICFFLR